MYKGYRFSSAYKTANFNQIIRSAPNLGQMMGTVAGLYKGATYNPDLVDPTTGKTRKLNNIERTGALLAGGALGNVGGSLVNSGATRGFNAVGRWAKAAKSGAVKPEVVSSIPNKARMVQ